MENFLTQITNYLLAQSWQIAVLVAVIAAVNLALKNKSAHVRYLLWLIVLAKCLVPPLLAIPLPILSQYKTPEPKLISNGEMPAVNVEMADTIRSKPLTLPSLPVKSPTIIERLARVTARQWLGLSWIAGATIFVLIAAAKASRTNFWLWQQRKQLPVEIQSGIEDLFYSLDFRTFPKVWMIEGIGQPFVWGLLRGSIYLPADFVKVNSSEHRRSVLGHELSHFLRFDAAVNILQIIAQAVFWFHPFVWWANKKIRAEREKCCDEMAIARLGAKATDYSSAIVNILISEHKSTQPVPSLAVAGPVKNIEERIKTMLRPGKKFYKRPSLLAATFVFLLALLTVPTALVLSARTEETKTASESEEKPSNSLHEAVVAGDIEQVKLHLSIDTAINAKDREGRTALHNAASGGYTEIAKLLLAKGADVNAKDEDDWTPLHYAAKNGHIDVAEVLIANGAATNTRDRWMGWTPIHRAAKSGHKEMVELLLENGVNVNSGNKSGQTPLEAAMNGNHDEVVDLLIANGAEISPLHVALYMKDTVKARNLIEAGADINKETHYGTTPLHRAVAAGFADIVKLLFAKGADVNSEDNRGTTPLHEAVFKGHKEMVELLLANGAIVKNSGNRSPAEFAMMRGHDEIVELLMAKGADVTPLHFALHQRDRARAISLIEAGADVNQCTSYGTSPLHLAVGAGLTDVAAILIEKGANVNAKTDYYWTPLHHAAYRSKDIVELLISKGANVNANNGDGRPPIWYAEREGNKDIVEVLLANGADANARTDNWTSLHTAAEEGNKDAAKLLISQGANVNAKDGAGRTALHIAALGGQKETVELLLQSGVNVNSGAEWGRTALHIAAREGYKEIVELLLEKGADVNANGYCNRTAVELAMVGGHSEIVELLISKGADISPLHMAIYMNDEAKAKSLIESGADLNKQAPYGTTPLNRSVEKNLKDITKLLIAKGADVNASDNWGWTPLHGAAQGGQKDIVELLIAKGANINTESDSGRTPLWYAKKNGHTEIVELLRKHGAKE